MYKNVKTNRRIGYSIRNGVISIFLWSITLVLFGRKKRSVELKNYITICKWHVSTVTMKLSDFIKDLMEGSENKVKSFTYNFEGHDFIGSIKKT